MTISLSSARSSRAVFAWPRGVIRRDLGSKVETCRVVKVSASLNVMVFILLIYAAFLAFFGFFSYFGLTTIGRFGFGGLVGQIVSWLYVFLAAIAILLSIFGVLTTSWR